MADQAIPIDQLIPPVGQIAQPTPQIHIRFDGRSFDFPQADLDIGPMSPDTHIRRAVAEHLGVPQVKLEAFAIDRSPSGELTLRPEAVFG